VVDFDSSANITRCVVEDIKTVEISIGDLMMNQMDEEEQPNPAEYIINRNGVDFIPSSKVLSAADEVIIAANPQFWAMVGLETVFQSSIYFCNSFIYIFSYFRLFSRGKVYIIFVVFGCESQCTHTIYTCIKSPCVAM